MSISVADKDDEQYDAVHFAKQLLEEGNKTVSIERAKSLYIRSLAHSHISIADSLEKISSSLESIANRLDRA